MSYLERKQKANPGEAGNLQTKKNELPTNKYNGFPSPSQQTLRRPSNEPDFRFIKIQEDSTVLKFTKVYTDGTKIFVRTSRLPKPIGGKFGTIVQLNPQTKKIESARFADWYEWSELRDSLKLSKIEQQFDYIELKIKSLAKALGVKP